MGTGFKIRGLKNGVDIISANERMPMFGSKTLERGTDYVLIFRKEDGDIALAGTAGRDIDGKTLGTRSFCLLRDVEMEYNEKTGHIRDISKMNKLGVISNVLYDAAEAREEDAILIENDIIKQRTGQEVPEETTKEKLRNINLKYHGAPATNSTKAILPTAQRLVSPRVQVKLFSEVLVVPLNDRLEPQYKDAKVMQINISAKKARQLSEIMSNPMYTDVNDTDGFLVVRFSYKGNTPQEAGMNPFTGAEVSARKIDVTRDENGQFTCKETAENIGSLINRIGTSDVIENRSSLVNNSCTTEDVEAALKKYLATNMDITAYIDTHTSDYVKKNAAILLEAGIFTKDSSKYKDLEAILKEAEESLDSDNGNETEDEHKSSNELNDTSSQLVSAKSVGDAVDILNNTTDDSGEDTDELGELE